jgi:hypothetical protein
MAERSQQWQQLQRFVEPMAAEAVQAIVAVSEHKTYTDTAAELYLLCKSPAARFGDGMAVLTAVAASATWTVTAS